MVYTNSRCSCSHDPHCRLPMAKTVARKTRGASSKQANWRAQAIEEPRVVAALPRLIRSSDAVISQAPRGSARRPLVHLTRATSTRTIAGEEQQSHGRGLQEQPELACQHEMDWHHDQRRDQHHPSGPTGTPVLEAGAQCGQQQRSSESERALALGRPEQVAEQDMGADGRADDDQQHRQREDQLLPVLLDELGGEARPGPFRRNVDFRCRQNGLGLHCRVWFESLSGFGETVEFLFFERDSTRPLEPPGCSLARLLSHAIEAWLELGMEFGGLGAPCDGGLVLFMAPAQIDDQSPGFGRSRLISNACSAQAIAAFGWLLATPRALPMQAAYSPARIDGCAAALALA